MLKLKKHYSKTEMTEIYDRSYLTEIAFYIGTNKYMDNIIKEELIDKIDDIDGLVAFYLYVDFVANRFMNCDDTDCYKYVDEYFEQDLADFKKEYFELVD